MNLAGLREGSVDAIRKAMYVSTGHFVNWITETTITNTVRIDLLQQFSLSDKCVRAVNEWTSVNFKELEAQCRGQRTRKLRKGQTKDAIDNERKSRRVFGEFIEEILHSQETLTTNWIRQLDQEAGKYLKHLTEVLKLMKKSIHNTAAGAPGIPPTPSCRLLVLNSVEVTWTEVTERFTEYSETYRSNKIDIVPAKDILSVIQMVRGAPDGVLLELIDVGDKKLNVGNDMQN